MRSEPTLFPDQVRRAPSPATIREKLDLPAARRTDPGTSTAAAQEAQRFAGEHHTKIIRALAAEPGLTGSEIGQRIGLTNVQVCRRLSELEQGGLAVPGRTKGRERRWFLTREGEDWAP